MARRLFIGFPVQLDGSVASLGAAVKKLRIGADRREIEFEWAPIENYHVTLNFLGATSPELFPRLSQAITKICDGYPPFESSLRGVGGFPDEHHARVLWIGVRKSRALALLQRDLTEVLSALGYRAEAREYVPHLTIARTRKSRTIKDLVSPFVRTKFGDVSVARLALYESVMHGPKPHYEILETFKLNPSAQVPESDNA